MDPRRAAFALLKRLGLAALGCILTLFFYIVLILLWGLIMASWIRIVHSNWISFLLLLLSALLSYLSVSYLIRLKKKTRQ